MCRYTLACFALFFPVFAVPGAPVAVASREEAHVCPVNAWLRCAAHKRTREPHPIDFSLVTVRLPGATSASKVLERRLIPRADEEAASRRFQDSDGLAQPGGRADASGGAGQ